MIIETRTGVTKSLKTPEEEAAPGGMMAPMVPLRGLIFLCLLHLCVQGVQGDVNTAVLEKMTQYFYDNVQPKNEQQTDAQYAIAISVPQDQYRKETFNIEDVFSKQDAVNVKDKLNKGEKCLLNEGDGCTSGNVIATRPDMNKKPEEHAEHILLYPLGNSPMDKLLEKADSQSISGLEDLKQQTCYKRVDTDGHPRQYATAISVPKDQCQQNFNLNTFLTQENAVNVKNAITDETNALYQGSELIAAGTRKVVIDKKKQYNIHSESLLLNPADNSPMSKLLNKRKDGCSVFYTFESPCVNTCLDATGSHSIIDALKNWKEHDGIKAFVFKNFWKFDTDKDLETKFKQIVAHVPLFRCVSENQCYACKGEGNTPIDAHCLPPKEI
ncbi:unnamed protein product [Leuciscus chuanchicus]